MNSSDIQKITDEYNNNFHLYADYTKRLKDLLPSLLDSEKINIHLIDGRVKSTESFCDKVKRKEKYLNPIEEITDKIGLRIITYYPKDVAEVINVIKSNFIIDEFNSFDAKEKLHDDTFGYVSTHLVASLDKTRSELPEWSKFSFLKFEIQIRTVLQHAWASISHELEYKKNYEIPSVMKRSLYRMAGLIELADEEFGRINIEHKKLEVAISKKEKLENVAVYEELSLDSIRSYISNKDNNQIISSINNIAYSAGFQDYKGYEDDSFGGNKERKNISEIISLAKLLEISTISELNEVLRKQLTYLDNYFKEIFSTSDTGDWHTTTVFNIVLVLLKLLNKEDISKFEKNISDGWSESIWNKVKSILIKIQDLETVSNPKYLD